jgi:hypothetical protein
VLSTAFDPSGKSLISCVLNSSELSVWDVSSLSIRESSPISLIPKNKATIAWNTENNKESENISFRINAQIKSDSPISSVDVYLNNNRFTSQRELPFDRFKPTIDFEQILFLNEGENQIKLIAYNDAGEASSEVLSITYIEPKPAPAIAEVVETKEEEPSLPISLEKSIDKDKSLVVQEKVVENTTVSEPLPEAKKIVEKVAESSLLDNLPRNPQNPYRFALIIGNEDYSSYQTGLESESDVEFAINDAKAFREFAVNILGVPTDNIILLTNARAIEMDDAVRKLNPIIKALNGKAEIFFYYAGHGFPDEKSKEPYLIPVDVSGTNLRFAVSLKDLYQSLTEHPSTRITVFLDACFSGGAREQGLVAARAVRVKPKEDQLKGNLVVFTASSGNESSLPYKEKGHGLFTYYLLDKLRETKGEISYKELSEYLSAQVGVRSVMVNNKPQTPQTNVSYDVEEIWGDWKLK